MHIKFHFITIEQFYNQKFKIFTIYNEKKPY